MSEKILDLTGMRFGKLTVIRMEKLCRARTGARWLCRCDCGAEILVKGTHLTHGQRTTCGNYGAHKASTVCKYQDTVRCTGGGLPAVWMESDCCQRAAAGNSAKVGSEWLIPVRGAMVGIPAAMITALPGRSGWQNMSRCCGGGGNIRTSGAIRRRRSRRTGGKDEGTCCL